MWQGIHLIEPPKTTHEESCWGESISLCSVWQMIHLKKQQKRHTKSHAEKNLYPCALCGEDIVSWKHLKGHIEDLYWRFYVSLWSVWQGIQLQESANKTHGSHNREITYHCSLCVRVFKFSNHLKKHIKSHPTENPFHCALCGKCFITWNTQIDTRRVLLEKIEITVFFVARNSSSGTK